MTAGMARTYPADMPIPGKAHERSPEFFTVERPWTNTNSIIQ